MKHPIYLFLLLSALVALPASACIWDRDTLAMEQARFPDTTELIAGYFPRHSKVYYQWRLEQIEAKPVTQRTAADYDDLAISYDKLGDPARGIEIMLEKIGRFPDQGRYESQANLGTLYIHDKQLAKGVEHIGRAIEINPEAHFGREIYQKLLVEYLLVCGWYFDPTEDFEESDYSFAPFKFDHFVLKDFEGDYKAEQEEIERAIKGVLGMMRFGHHDSPILLAALGDLLRHQQDEGGGQRLAARAYLKASYETDNPVFAQAMRQLAEYSLQTQLGEKLANIEVDLKDEIERGDAYFAKIEADEQAWAEAGKDLDAEFQRVYYENPVSMASKVTLSDRYQAMNPVNLALLWLGVGAILLALILGFAAYSVIRRLRARKQQTDSLT